MPSVLLICFLILGLILILFWIGAFLIIYHLIRFGIGSEPKKAVAIFFVGSAILSFLAALCFGLVVINGGLKFGSLDYHIPEKGIIDLHDVRIFDNSALREHSSD